MRSFAASRPVEKSRAEKPPESGSSQGTGKPSDQISSAGPSSSPEQNRLVWSKQQEVPQKGQADRPSRDPAVTLKPQASYLRAKLQRGNLDRNKIALDEDFPRSTSGDLARKMQRPTPQILPGVRSSASNKQCSENSSSTTGFQGPMMSNPPSGPAQGPLSSWKGKEKVNPIHGTTPLPDIGAGQEASSATCISIPTTLLQLLSCRKLERFPPHSKQRNQRVEFKDVTKSGNYPIKDVRKTCSFWPQFTFQRMLEDFPIVRRNVPAPPQSRPESPGFWVTNEGQFHSSLDTHLLKHMRHYLRITFDVFRSWLQERSAVEVSIRNGHFTKEIRRKVPDIGVFEIGERNRNAEAAADKKISPPVNRMIVEVKPSSKWNPYWWDIGTDGPTSAGEGIYITDQVFYAPLAQIHYYMRHSGNNNMGPHYGVLLTDEYLVPVYRPGPKGELQLGEPVPWSRHFAEDQDIDDFTVQSALWYLCLLSSLKEWAPGASDSESSSSGPAKKMARR